MISSYRPEIFPLECSSGLLLLKPRPPPLCGMLEDPVFVFPEVREPRCKLLYLWRQSLFLGRKSTNWKGEDILLARKHVAPHADLALSC